MEVLTISLCDVFGFCLFKSAPLMVFGCTIPFLSNKLNTALSLLHEKYKKRNTMQTQLDINSNVNTLKNQLDGKSRGVLC